MPITTGRFRAQDANGNQLDDSTSAALMRLGPVLQVVLVPPDGATDGEPQQGAAIIDTGATQTCVDAETAKSAGWPMIDTAKLSSVTHPDHEVPVFAGHLSCPTLGNTIHVPRWMGVNLRPDEADLPVVGLIGRDLLQQAIFIYNGHDGSFSLALP